MPVLMVDPAQYDSAAGDLTSVAHSLSGALDSLSGALGVSSGMGGSDNAGADWAGGYDSAARAALDAGTAALTAAGGVATRLHATGSNYAFADTASTIGAGDFTMTPPPALPGSTSLGLPSASGAGSGGEPFGWSLVSGLIGYLWPNGHQDRLHAADAAWKSAAAQLQSAIAPVDPASVKILAQRTPESAAASKATTDVGTHIGDLAAAFVEIGDSCAAYAGHLDQAHHEIISEVESLVAQTVAIEAVSALVGVFTVGIGELAGQAVEATRLAAAVAKIRTIIEALIEAARVAAIAVGRVAGRVGELVSKLEPLVTGAVKTATSTILKVSKDTGVVVARNIGPAAEAVIGAAPKNFAAGAGMEAAKEGVVSLGTGENHMDLNKIVSQGEVSVAASPIAQKVASVAPLADANLNKYVEQSLRLGIQQATKASLTTAQQAMLELIDPDAAESVSPTSMLDAAKNLPSVIDDALEAANRPLVNFEAPALFDAVGSP